MTMRRWSLPIWAGYSFLALLVSGCGQDPFSAPSRPKPVASSGDVESAKSIFFIVPSVPEGDIMVWGYAAQAEANLHQVVFRIMGPSPGDPPDRQPEIIRKAIADGVSALIVVPGESPDLPKALSEAEAKNIPVVLLGGSISTPAGSKPFTVVDHEPFEKSAGRIVATTVEDLKKIGRSAEGAALIVTDRKTDVSSARRVAALKGAASSAGFSPVVMVPIDGSNRDKAKLTVLDAVKSNPNIAIALADNDESMLAAANGRMGRKGDPAFFVGGYTGHATETAGFPFKMESCQVEGRFHDLGRLAVRTLLSRLKGESVPELVAQEPKFTRGRAKAWAEGDSYTDYPGTARAQPEASSPNAPPSPVESKPQ
jgi:ABC-type sugar transport system substrate-binding protein